MVGLPYRHQRTILAEQDVGGGSGEGKLGGGVEEATFFLNTRYV